MIKLPGEKLTLEQKIEIFNNFDPENQVYDFTDFDYIISELYGWNMFDMVNNLINVPNGLTEYFVINDLGHVKFHDDYSLNEFFKGIHYIDGLN